MGHGAGSAAAHGEAAVTPVIGTVMILAITILGIGTIMLWGAPTLQAIQDRNALTAMEGEFLQVRTDTLELLIDKSSRLPEVVVEVGTLAVDRGTRFLLTNNAFGDPDDTGCDMHVTQWNDAVVDGFQVAITGTPCSIADLPACPAAPYCLELHSVAGSSTIDRPVTANGGGVYTTVDVDLDLTTGDWVFRIRDASDAAVAQAWLLSTNRVSWEHASSASDVAAYVEAGAVFERNGPKVFLLKPPAIQEAAFGSNDFLVRMPMYVGDDLSAISGRASVQLFIGQVGNSQVRVSDADTTHLRFDFAGSLAEAWCNSLLFRNVPASVGSYAEDAAHPCTALVPSVIFTPASSEMSYELIHARITARIQS